MNVNASMQNLSSPNASVASGEMDALTALSQQLEITPEMLAENPELAMLLEGNKEGLDFEALLESESGKGEKALGDLLKGLKKATGEVAENVENLKGEKSILGQKPATELINQKVDPEIIIGMKNQKIDPKIQAKIEQGILKGNPEDQKSEKLEKAGLVNLEEFVKNQSPTKKAAMKNAYKNSMSESMFAKKIDAQVPSLSGTEPSKSMKITDLMLAGNDSQDGSESMHSGKNQTTQIQNQNSTAVGKTFNMNALTSDDSGEVIGKIQDYIIQSRASNAPTVQMSFEHKELGMIDLQVTRTGSNELNIMINSRTQEGAKFFTQNQGELLQSLSQAGIQVADLKLDSSSSTNLSQNGNESSPGQSEKGQPGQPRDQRNSDSKKREELWKLFDQREAA